MMNTNELPVVRLSIQEKIRTARDLLALWGDDLRKDPAIGRLLESLKQRTAASRKAMFDLGVVSTCKYCDEQEGGSCCGAGIENRYSPVLLVVNVLLEAMLPEEPLDEHSCYFLGKSGCSLMAREVLCVNYLCSKIQRKLMPEDLINLQNINGEELDAVFLLQEAVKKFMTR